MMHAVKRRAWKLLGLQSDNEPYPRHDYTYNEVPGPTSKQPPLYYDWPPEEASRPATSAQFRKKLYREASKDVSLNSGCDYPCKQSDLDATGGLARQYFLKDKIEERGLSRKEWFAHKNHGPFISARQAALDVFEHNTSRRKIRRVEQEAIARLSLAIAAGRAGSWGPDLIIKAFCDLDIVFFGGRLRGHVCVRWLPDWGLPGRTVLGTAVYIGKGKSAIKMNADAILMSHQEPFERMFATMLHEMW